MAFLHAAFIAGCYLMGPLGPSLNPEECHQLGAMMKTWKGEARELAQSHVAGRAGGQGSEPGWAWQEEAKGLAPGKEEGWQEWLGFGRARVTQAGFVERSGPAALADPTALKTQCLCTCCSLLSIHPALPAAAS